MKLNEEKNLLEQKIELKSHSSKVTELNENIEDPVVVKRKKKILKKKNLFEDSLNENTSDHKSNDITHGLEDEVSSPHARTPMGWMDGKFDTREEMETRTE